MRAHAPRDFTLCKAALLAALIGLGHFLAHKAQAEEVAFACPDVQMCDRALRDT